MPMNEKPKAGATDLDPAGVANLVNAMFEDRIPVITRLASCADFLSAARATGPQCRPADGWTHIGRRHLGDRVGECDQVHALEMVPDVAADAGWVNVNEGTNYWESHLPFGGRAGSQSGVGRVGGRFSMDRLTELKTVVIDLG